MKTKMKNKIVMVYPHIKSEKGISAYSSNLVNSLRKQNVEIDEVTFTAGKFWSLFKNMPNLLKYKTIHLQHEYNLLGGYGIPYFFLLTILGTIFQKKIIITMHTVLSQSQQFEGSKIKTFLRKFLYNRQNRHIDGTTKLIVVHAQFFKDILVMEYGVPEEKIKVIPHGIIENIKNEKTINKEQAKKELGLSGPVYLMIGTLIPDHGADIILKQADKIGKTILVVTNPLGGNDRNKEKIQNYIWFCKSIIKAKGFEKYVRLDFKEIGYGLWWKYFVASDLILLPYKGGIGSGIFADALAVGKPVIASNIKYFREIYNKYDCINLARDDKDFPRVIKYAMMPENYKKMLLGCRRYFDENNLTVVAKKYKAIYNSACVGGLK